MKLIIPLALLALISAPGWGAAEEDEQTLYRTEGEELLPGEALYKANCAVCHDGGVPKAPERTMLGLMSPTTILSSLRVGVMKEQAAALSDSDKQLLAEHLAGQRVEDVRMAIRAPMCSADNAKFDFSSPPDTAGWGVDTGNHRLFDDSITNITVNNIDKLELKWAFAFPGAVRARSQPATAGGSLFVGSQDGTVYSLDQETGCIRWQFTASAEVRTAIVIEDWDEGESREPLAYFGDLVGNLYAVNAVTGELAWRDRPDTHPSLTLTAAPALYDGKLYAPISSLEVTAAASPAYACCTFRGGIAIYDAKTGEKLKLIRSISQEPGVVGKNAVGTDQIGPSGAPIWNTPSIDTKRRLIYLGTGENYSSPANDTSDAILALSMDDFSIVWSRQATKGDAWNVGCETPERINCPAEDGPDYDFAAATILATSKTGKDVILAGQKSGEVFALDPDNKGEIIWQKKLGRGGIQGGVHFGMAADGDVLYVPMSDFDGGERWPGEPFPGMYAVDITTGKVLWFTRTEDRCEGRKYCQPGISAAVSAIEGGVVGGAMDGILRVYDKASGSVRWQFDSTRSYNTLGGGVAEGGSFGGGVGPVFKDDKMFLSSGYGIYLHMPGNVLLAFELPTSADGQQ